MKPDEFVEVLGGDTVVVEVKKTSDDVPIEGVKAEVRIEVGIVAEIMVGNVVGNTVGNVLGNIVGNVVGNVEGIRIIDVVKVEVEVKKGEGRKNADDVRNLLVEKEKISDGAFLGGKLLPKNL
jgi:hypothetical protein